MRRRHQLMVVGLAVAAWLATFGDKTPVTGIAQPVARAPLSSPASVAASTSIAPQSSAAQSDYPEHEPVILALQTRETLIGESPREASNGASLFTSQSWTPPPPPPPKPPPPPPPTAPPLPFVYLGKKIEDGAWEVFVARGDRTYIVRERSLLDGMYRIDSIKPPLLSLTYIPMNQVQTLAIGGSD